MADNGSSSSPSSSSEVSSTAADRSQLERRSSKSRLLKQDVIEETELPEKTDLPQQTTTAAPPADEASFPDTGRTDAGAKTRLESGTEADDDDDHSPNSDSSDQTVVPAESLASSTATPHSSPKDNSPEDASSVGAQKLPDSDKGSPTQAINPKVKLVRSQAVYDDTSSPPPEILIRSAATTGSSTSPLRDVLSGGKVCMSPVPYSGGTATLSVSPTFQIRGSGRQRLGQDSSQGSTVSDNSPALSRDSSFETSYTDSTGTNLEEFIIKTLNKKQSDRTMLLHLESDMIAFIKDTSQEKHRFPQMSSYHRMLVHRVAAFFGLDHNVDETGKAVIINRLECTRIPDFKFRDHVRDELPQEDPPKKFILKRHRDCTSLEETRGTDRVSVENRMSKSFEERQEEYHEARDRIFQQRELLQEMGRTHPPVNRPSNLCGGSSQSSKDDVRWHPDLRPWSSTDSSGYSTDSSSRLKVYVTKASSFHSVTVLTRGDSRTSTASSASRFSKTDSLSSGISNLGSPIVIPPTIPSSPPLEDQEFESGSEVSVVSPSQRKTLPAEDHQTVSSPFLSFTDETGEPLAIWVASTIDQIPAGSIIINPQTGEPYINADGSIYRWYPPSDWGASDRAALQSMESSTAEEQSDMEAHQDVDNSAFNHRFSAISMEDPPSHLDIASPNSATSHHLHHHHHHPVHQVYLVAPGRVGPSLAPSSAQRVSMQPIYPPPPAPPPPSLHHHHRAVPFFPSPPSGAGQPPSVRYVCQLPALAAAYEGVDPQGQGQGQGQGQAQLFESSYPQSDVCQVMAFPQHHQMTIHSVDAYSPAADHGCYPPPQVMPCLYVPQQVENPLPLPPPPPPPPPPKPGHVVSGGPHQILYVPASVCGGPGGPGGTAPGCYSVDGASSSSLPNQGHVQVIRVNALAPATPTGGGHVFYAGTLRTGAGTQRTGPVPPLPQYVCYTYPGAGEMGGAAGGHPSNSPLGVPSSSYPPPAAVSASFVRPTRVSYPAGGPMGHGPPPPPPPPPPRSASPKSPQQQQQHHLSQFKVYVGNAVARASSLESSGSDQGARELVGPYLPRGHLPSTRLMPLRQPHVVFSSGPQASFPLGDCRHPLQNAPTVFQNIIRPRARVIDASVCDHVDPGSQCQGHSSSVRECGSREEDTGKGQQPRLG